MAMRFSIIIPLYNKESYVKKALESVYSQTYTDYEVIVVDDGSTDKSLDVSEEFLKSQMSNKQSPFIIITHQKNQGVGAARNRGVKESIGEYVVFLDADDWWEPTFLEEMDRLIRDYPDAGIYAMNYIYYKPGKTHVALNIERGYINYPDTYARTGAMPITSISACLPRTIFEEMGGFPIGIRLGEDFLLWAKTAMHYRVAFCEKPLAYYNNDIPASMRATRNLHAPQYHMLFHLGPIENEIAQLSDVAQQRVWRDLLDKLRVNGLLEYWMSKDYHKDAAAELAKVDWSCQPRYSIRRYKKPLWMLRKQQCIMRVLSSWKQKLISIRYH